jgi:hypothetical protein
MVLRVAALIALCSVFLPVPCVRCQVFVSSATETFEIEEKQLPLSFSVPPGSRLYVGGSRITDALFERTARDSLSLNGTALQLSPWTPVIRHWHMSDGRLLAICGGTPYFEKQLSDGASVAAAANRLWRARDKLHDVAMEAYAREKESGSGEPHASDAVLEALHTADSDSLIDWTFPVLVLGGSVRFHWREAAPRFGHVFVLRTEPVAPDFRRPESVDRKYVTAIHYYTCECPDTCWVFIEKSGSGAAYCGRMAREAVRAQLERAFKTGDYGDYPLSPQQVEAIVRNETPPN